MQKTSDLHVIETRPLLSPAFIKSEFPLSETAATLVSDTRDRIRQILAGEDQRMLVIVGPCSIHDVDAAMEYGEKLTHLRAELQNELEIVMRVYFEKPRTTVGWKGLINDPHLDNSYDINTGLRLARKLLSDLAHINLPAATELLDPITPQYIADLICWTAIGARTTESQIHRQMASGLSMPVGYKNSTDGSFKAAINAMLAARISHHFLGINNDGLASIVKTTGNPDGHLVLRGGGDEPNYNGEKVSAAANSLKNKALNHRLVIDCSHGNSDKDYNRQPIVLEDIAQQVLASAPNIVGVMIESHLIAGNQKLKGDLSSLAYGQSITDACVNWETTQKMLRSLGNAVAQGRPKVRQNPVLQGG
ncbi:3-deoxy-D-arabino-heptulosonate-7-phosphate synthase, phenylalanine repressible [Hyella patelloides LEGE 07179]|uniref:Phospho-2-dehydro-3-deoxyheptonate aldolase n=1 Tax=Hyella patelloides LEGE 07179 TaxID=945734 RepID=A0A563VSR3_9CYAN|nr:3-deoxy-7-phosphoheptulonate synthase [Hyella patelloides]VEP14451.1 3-deoxy-D-arabino-heptulosonate-7-phosphate synthase, phenylalanine repressible [Hyella patelloides LEGE 07179]